MTRGIPALAAVLALGACSSGASPKSEMAPAREPAVAVREERVRPAPEPLKVDADQGIAARVNNEIVTWKDVGDSLSKVKAAISPELRRQTLRQMVEERLFLQAARKNGVAVGEQELDDAVRRDIKTYGGEEEYERWLRLRNLTKTEAREEKRKTILIYKLYRHIIQKSFQQPDATTPGLLVDSVAPVEVAEFYEKNKGRFQAIENVTFSRIALQFANPGEKEAKYALALSILRHLDEGGDFVMMSIHHSAIRMARDQEYRNKSRKDLDGFAPATLALLFETLKVGETSEVVEDGQTWNIFRLEKRIHQREESAAEAEPKIRATLESEKREENRRKLRDRLVRDAYLWPSDLFDEE
ncbi:MAG TPA: SurA N-terminal domain-containing protein [Planctomycetota bacterium]